jgi:hypothetical protein
MKYLITAGALFLGSALAHAQSTHWTFSYTGFYDKEAAQFMPDARIDGSFSGHDGNADGVLERGELTSLLLGSMDYVACAGSSNASYHCGADSFRFSPNEGLSFSLGEYGGDPEGWTGGGYLVTTGDMSYQYRYDPYSNTEHHLYWTEGTTLNMMSAVPEAPAWTMLLAGVAGLGVRARFWGKKGSDPGVQPAA